MLHLVARDEPQQGTRSLRSFARLASQAQER